MTPANAHSFQNLQSLTEATGGSNASGQSALPVIAGLLGLAETWKQVIASLHTYKFACVESGDSETFDLLDAIQRRAAADLDQLNHAIQRHVAATSSTCNPPD